MQNATLGLGFWLGLAIGLSFVAGAVTASLVPSASAQATRTYEYRTVEHGFDGGRWANEMGGAGWRFVGFDGGNAHVLIFERAR